MGGSTLDVVTTTLHVRAIGVVHSLHPNNNIDSLMLTLPSNIRRWKRKIHGLRMWHLRSVHIGPKSQPYYRIPTCEPRIITKIWLIIIKVNSWLFYAKLFVGLELSWVWFLLNPTRNINCKPHLKKDAIM